MSQNEFVKNTFWLKLQIGTKSCRNLHDIVKVITKASTALKNNHYILLATSLLVSNGVHVDLRLLVLLSIARDTYFVDIFIDVADQVF